jgi:hypothetical protein
LIRAAAAERLALSAAAFEDKGNSGSGADHPGIKKDNIAANSQDDYITVDGEKKIKEPTNKRIIFDGNARVDPSAALLLFRRKYRPIV